ncbi:hypothetical protein ABT255_59910, partial [Streptomyces mirabilis]|uniref:hypothetical protein n=1 Tax=Streptomyces mirabilis TaxID=68239 RepID=UPI00331ADA04
LRAVPVERVVSVELTADGYVVTCPGSPVVGRGPTESEAWRDFWAAERASWKPTGASGGTPGDRLPQRRVKRVRIRTIRVRDLFG